MRTHHLLNGIAALAAAGLLGCGLPPNQTPKPQGRGADGAAKEAEEKTEEFEYALVGEKEKRTRQVLTLDLGDGVKMEFVRIKAGKFQMGSPDSDQDSVGPAEKPRHEVEITKDFYLGKYLVTQEQYQAVTGENPSCFSASGDCKNDLDGQSTGRFPVEQVSWEDAQAFCKKLSEKVHRKAVLPTEAQWEYACRAGTETRFYCGDDLTTKDANFSDLQLHRTSAVGSYAANPWGLYDMHGDVDEWCADYYDAKYYGIADTKDPENDNASDTRVCRGGAWDYGSRDCRAAYRVGHFPGLRNYGVGLRVCFRLD